MAKNSEIIICKNIKLDKNYSNVLNYTEEKMVELCRANQQASLSNYSFINQDRNIITTGFSYADCLKCNYIAFQNSDYDNKWFFAFIDDVIFSSDSATQIKFTIDVWATWWDYWQASRCFVVREHVADDTRGLHTVPEDLETGDYMNCYEENFDSLGANISDLCYVLASTTSWKTKKDAFSDAEAQEPNGGAMYFGVYSGAKFYRMNTEKDVKEALSQMAEAGQIDNVVSVFMAPKILCPEKEKDSNDASYGDREIKSILLPYSLSKAFNRWDMIGSNIDNYTPRNKKLLCYPYSYLMVSNGVGGNSIYKYEDFYYTSEDESSTMIQFEIALSLVPSISGKIIPRYYKGLSRNYDYGIPLGKYPICAFQTDSYTNWLVQNSVNILGERITNDQMTMGASIATGIVGIGASIATGNIAGAGLGVMSTGIGVANSIQSMRNHENIPPQTTQSQATGDVTCALGYIAPRVYNISIKPEYARIIDEYFDRFGYKVNRTKVPNLQGRPHWSYIQIASNEQIGYGSVPSAYMQLINNICQKGVTIWKNHAEIGDFTLDNTI